jgi:hypothetical protein
MGCSMRVAVTPDRDENLAGEVEVGYGTYSDFSDWVDEAFELTDDRRGAYPHLRRPVDENDVEAGDEYTPEFVRRIAARFPDPWATPYPGIIQLFLDAAAKGVAVHHYL